MPPLDHNHPRDFKCPDCAAIITCLSCVEINAAALPKGPGFVDNDQLQQQTVVDPQVETISTTNDFDLILGDFQPLQTSLFA